MQSGYTKANLYDIRDDEDEVDDKIIPREKLDVIVDGEQIQRLQKIDQQRKMATYRRN